MATRRMTDYPNIDKKLYPNTQDALRVEDAKATTIDLMPAPDTTPDNIQIINDEEGGATVDFDPQKQGLEDQGHDSNLAEALDDDTLDQISRDLRKDYDNDKSSRDDWEHAYTNGLDLLGFKYEERDKPFAGASGVTHPLLAESVTQFQAQAYKELLPAGGPVNVQVIGEVTPEVDAQAKRVKEFMNYQVTNVMQEFDPELDQMLFHLPLAGSAFKKVYYDANLERAVSKFVAAEDLVVPYLISDLDTCMRVTHIVKMKSNELRKRQVAGLYRDIELQPTRAKSSDTQVKENEIAGSTDT